VCHAGDIFGELAILYRQPRAANVVSCGESTVYELHEKAFWAAAKKSRKQWELLALSIFQHFDKDASGQIDAEEAFEAMRSLGPHLTREVVLALIMQYDTDGNGEIDFEEFMNMLDQLSASQQDFRLT